MESGKGPLLGDGGAAILEAIEKFGSIGKAAEKLGMSYKYVWDYLANIEKEYGKPVVETYRGGKKGGGGAKLTEEGRKLLSEFRRVKLKLTEAVKNTAYRGIEESLSARNRLKGVVESLKEEGLTVEAKIKVKTPTTLTVILTKEAVETLNLKVGSKVEALIKATGIMIAKTKR